MAKTSADVTRQILSSPDPMIELMAERWHDEERAAGNGRAPWSLLTDEERDAARKRTALVLDGEVKWSETGAGDRAIWSGGRQRSRHAWARAKVALEEIAKRRTTPPSRDVVDVLWGHLYDTLNVNANTYDGRLFQSANIGNTRLTNLYVGGMMPASIDFFAADFYITLRGTHGEAARAEAMNFIDNSTARLMVGEKSQSPEIPLRDLLDRRPIDCLIRERSSYLVDVRCFSRPTLSETSFDVVFHLDGGLCRSLY